METGQIMEVNIIDVNYMGKGVAKINDFVIFVADTITGDKALIKITEVKRNYAIGELIQIINNSEIRILPICDYFNQCGGCQLMNMSYEHQLLYKKNRVINELKRACVNIDNISVNNTLGMESPIRYRNKTTFSVSMKKDEIIIGPYEQGTYNTVNIDKCLLQSEIGDKAVSVFKDLMIKYKLKPYNKSTKKGIVKNLVIRNNKLNELMFIIVTATDQIPNIKKIIKELIDSVKEIKTVVQNINPINTNLVMGKRNITLYGEGTIKDTIEDLEFTISPETFFQINSIQTEKLYKTAIEYANLNKDDICFDLYCGIGTISLLAAKYAKKVYGVEIVEQSIINARENSITNNIKNVEFYAGKTEEILPTLHENNIIADVIILDPPRKGCEMHVLDTIINMSPKKIVYVSC
ncbi:MAG: 23S rRNA (uracil(1939)-C(5))-methyltransferase RlmD, partial [Tissierellia bacterium]|nr:23S rRNA (uracil(1939)-C(5))-methyltransferase RlmD [Tissierellia bacterium]